ncbi:LysR substrate-binding domain-containing protein [Parashewanella tropica]|uniref:LysR substrate-binding domain-containing protein n=1 Tax=Parashewanella tropica TaxID=2547970 RepID=UPI00105A45B6|nr:LysR substrate-binding domain-containing protein [Parashewanella tropica]
MAQWQGVNEFICVAESQSFTVAAERLGLSVVKVSRQVSALEASIGVKLLHRTTRKVALTDAGKLYYQSCKPLVEGLEQAELAVTQMQQQAKGLIRITAPTTYGERFIGPLLNDFLLQHPQLDVELIFTNRKLDLIEQHIDVAIRLGQLRDSTMIAKRLANRQLYVCASPSYIAKFGEPHTLSELSQHQCLMGTLSHWRFQDSNRPRTVQINGRMSCNSGQVLYDSALKGLGLVQLPDYYVQSALENGQLVEVLSRYRDVNEGIWALYPHNRQLSYKVKVLIEFLQKRLSTGT